MPSKSFFPFFFPVSASFFLHPTAPQFIGILTHFGQKIVFKAISWLYKGKSNFEKLRGEQDFLILSGLRYNFPKLTYGRPWVKGFYSLKTQMLNDFGYFKPILLAIKNALRKDGRSLTSDYKSHVEILSYITH